ncbi:MAG TPA: replication-associated recombination protein A [Saprospiraceae bacterium]|nr:replication-associated recombination protein A [Saprospiraceae bacterium]
MSNVDFRTHMLPLAERMRPQSLEDVLGQDHLLSPGKPLNLALSGGHLPSMIFWGPPGVGKTSLARLLGKQFNRKFFTLSAISAGVKDLRELINEAKSQKFFNSPSPILFIDEIHRFNKGQQDALLAAVEDGTIVLLGATTENPSFEVNAALLSRMQVYVLKHLDELDLVKLIERIADKDELFQNKNIKVLETDSLVELSGGDARKLCNIMEIVGNLPQSEINITNDLIRTLVTQNMAIYDKSGEMHYDIISAFIKSIRGSDPHAALYWLARMVDGGEDPLFIARRLLILAAEDIGLANPNALLMANTCKDAIHFVGWPESRIILAETVIYLACSPKSNSAYLAIEMAISLAQSTNNAQVPLHLRNAPTQMMKNIGYGKSYEYSHHHPGNFVYQEYMPEQLSSKAIFKPAENPNEQKMKMSLLEWWGEKYK